MEWDYFNQLNYSNYNRCLFWFQFINQIDFFAFNYYNHLDISLIFKIIPNNLFYLKNQSYFRLEISSISFHHFWLFFYFNQNFMIFFPSKNLFFHRSFQFLCFPLCWYFFIYGSQPFNFGWNYKKMELLFIYLNRYLFEIYFSRKYISIIIIMLSLRTVLITCVSEVSYN